MKPGTVLIAAKTIEAQLKKVQSGAKEKLSEDMVVEDRKTVQEVLDGKPVKLGSVTYVKGRAAFKVTNEAAFLRWVEEHHPDAVEMKPTVPEWFVKNLLDAEGFDPSTGEEVDGIGLVEGDPYMRALPAKDAEESLRALAAAGAIDWAEVLELEPGDRP